MTSRTLRATLEADGPALGAWLQMPNPIAAEAVGRLGFDWIGIDTQHGMIGYESMLAMLQAIAVSGTPAIVRVSTNDLAEIGRALDSGAQGVIVPLIETAEQAARVVDAMRYPRVDTAVGVPSDRCWRIGRTPRRSVTSWPSASRWSRPSRGWR